MIFSRQHFQDSNLQLTLTLNKPCVFTCIGTLWQDRHCGDLQPWWHLQTCICTNHWHWWSQVHIVDLPQPE